MQARLVIGLSFLIISLGGFSQTFNVCNNSEVVFEMEENYWGEPVWEYSVDSLEWEELEFDASEPFIVSEEMSGYYRLKMVDASCDTSFVSQAEFIQVNEDPEIELTIHSWFSDNVVPEGVDPFFWVLGDTALSELTFFVNDETYESEASGGYISNPGSEFQIYAIATHLLSGCTLFSDTATYSVPNQTIQANALFDITGNFSLSEISVSSSVDSVGLNGDSNFLIEYSESQGLDFLHAYSNNLAVDSQLVAIEIVEPGTGFITMDNTSTAVALVCSHPALAIEMWLNFPELQEQALSHSQFSDLVSAIDNSIDVYGYLNFNGTDIQVLTSAIAENISEEINAGFQSRDLNEYPLLEPQDDGSLLYDPNGIRTFYAARLYDQTTALSSIMIMPSAQNIWQLPVVQIMLNGLMGISEYATALTSEFVWNETITEAELSSDGTYLDFNTRLTNGLDFSPDFSSEEISIVRLINNLNIQFQMIFMVAGTSVEIIAETPIVSLASSIIEFTAGIFAGDVLTIAEIAELCLPAVGAIVGLFAGGSIVAGIVIGAAVVLATYNIAEFFAGLIVAKKEVFYTNSLLGNRMRNRISVESNSDANFEGIPGAYTYEIPYIRLTEQKRIYEGYSAESELIYEGSLNTYPFSDDVDVSSSATNVQNVIVLGDIEFGGGAIESHPLEVSANVFEWQMAWNSNGGETAELDLSLNYQGQPLSEMGGLNSEGTISFEASIENPIIEIVQGNNQIGVPNEFLPEECQIQISGSNGASVYFPYPIRFDASTGGGKVQYPGQTEEYTALNTTVVSFGGEEGIGRIKWKPGSGTDNVLVAEVINPSNDLAVIQIEFGVNVVDCEELQLNIGDPCDDGDPNTINEMVNENCECAGTVNCIQGETEIVEVLNSETGKYWMDRNLGASQAAASLDDELAYGDLYQWGRFSDGHQCRNSDISTVLSEFLTPGHDDFILTAIGIGHWVVDSNDSLANMWQGLSGYNNPCPNGYRIPSKSEWISEIETWETQDENGAFNSVLKLQPAGIRDGMNGLIYSSLSYWTATTAFSSFGPQFAYKVTATETSANLNGVHFKASGVSVRCIKGELDCPELDLGLNIGDVCITIDSNGNDVLGAVGANCECMVIQSYDCPALEANIGDPCDDGNPFTINDTVNQNCDCMGQNDYDCPNLQLNIGDPCNDGNPNTTNDAVNQSCECLGQNTFDCPELMLDFWEPCDDGNPNTSNDIVDENCNCEGSLPVFCEVNETVIVDVQNSETGKYWMDRNLGASQVATSYSDSLAYGDLYQWGRFSDGHQCRNSEITESVSQTIFPSHDEFIISPFIYYETWLQNSHDSLIFLWQGLDGPNNPCPDGYRIPTKSEWQSEIDSWENQNSAGAFNSVLKLTRTNPRDAVTGELIINNSAYGSYWTSTLQDFHSAWIAGFDQWNGHAGYSNNLATGLSVRCIKGQTQCSILGLNIGDPCNTGNSNIDIGSGFVNDNCECQSVEYDCPSLQADIGDPCNDGNPNTTNDAVNQSCECLGLADNESDYPVGTIHCIPGGAQVVEVLNPETDKRWMDRNLGASQTATSLFDELAHGDLYQWGRFSDGHQCRESELNNSLSASPQPDHGEFITVPSFPSASPFDWLNPQNDNLWQGVNGLNNPCPSAYRLPSEAELEAERNSWDSNDQGGAFLSPLKLVPAGFRNHDTGGLSSIGSFGVLWSSTLSGSSAINLGFGFSSASIGTDARAYGFSIRCIKD